MYKGAQNLLLNQKRKRQSTIKFDAQSMRVLELRNQDVELPQDDDTKYWCKVFKLPVDLKTKHHIIRVRKYLFNILSFLFSYFFEDFYFCFIL